MLLNKGLYDLHRSPGVVRIVQYRRLRCGRIVTRMRETKNRHRILVRKPL